MTVAQAQLPAPAPTSQCPGTELCWVVWWELQSMSDGQQNRTCSWENQDAKQPLDLNCGPSPSAAAA